MVRLKSRVDSVSLILCAGRVQRIGGYHKQLLPVGGGESFVQRIVRQSRERCSIPIVVTRNADIRRAAGAESYDPGSTASILETMGATCHLWGNRTNILLGDVCYSRNFMDRINQSRLSLEIFGNLRDILAVSFDIDHFDDVFDALEIALFTDPIAPSVARMFISATDFDPTPFVKKQNPLYGTLIHFYQAIVRKQRNCFCQIDDYSRDIDTFEDYAIFRSRVLRGGQLDDN